MCKCKFSSDRVSKLLDELNLSCGKLGKILDISGYHVFSYLFGDGRIVKTDEAIKLDSAIAILQHQRTKRPVWNVGESKRKTYDEVLGWWDDQLRQLVKKEIERKTKLACDLIFCIITEPDEDEFHKSKDPLHDCGLEKYGTKAFFKRIENIRSF